MTGDGSTLSAAQAIAQAMRDQREGNLKIAEARYHQILQRAPDHEVALHGMGVVAYRRKDYPAAIAWIARATAVNAREPNYHNTLAACYRAMGRLEEAIASCLKAISLSPGQVNAHFNLGNALRDRGDHEGAIASYQQVLALKPEFADARFNLANTLVDAGRPGEALVHYREVLVLRPDHAQTRFAHALALLMNGELTAGWNEYEWRHESHARVQGVYREFPQPLWDGKAREGQRILLYAEQGFGDALQFVRYVPLVAGRGARVIVECRAELMRLFRDVAGVENVVRRGGQLPEFDVRYPLLSLPLLFGTTLDSIPARVPYIAARSDAIAQWRARLQPDARLNVGLAWSGSPTSKLNARKTCPLAQFSKLAGIPGIHFHSLQKGPAAAQAAQLESGMKMCDWADELNDFADTAALAKNLDLVISVDTAVAHLAGALGKPVWLLLSFEGDWRWLVDRTDSPWYPSMRIFRQRSPGQWLEVMQQVAGALQGLAPGT